MNKFYVYLYLRSSNSKHGEIGSPYYVGKGKGGRMFAKRTHTQRPSDRANIVIVASGLTEPDAFQLEMLLIYHYGRIDLGRGSLRNRTDGGEGVFGFKSSLKGKSRPKFSDEWRANLSAAHMGLPSGRKGLTSSPETCRKIGDSKRGLTLSLEHRAKVSAALTGKKRAPFSDEHRANIAAAKIGKTHSLETRAKMSEAHKRGN